MEKSTHEKDRILSLACIETLGQVYLIPSAKKRHKRFLYCREGKIADLDGSASVDSAVPSLFFEKRLHEKFIQLRKQIEIFARKQRLHSASTLLAESIIAMLAECRQYFNLNDRLTELLNVTPVPARVFIGIPSSMCSLAEGYMEAIAGINVGRFSTGLIVEVMHQRIFGKKGSHGDENGVNAGLWITREPYEINVLGICLDGEAPEKTRLHYLTLVASSLALNFRSELESDQSICAALGTPILDTKSIFSANLLRIDALVSDSEKIELVQLKDWAPLIPLGVSGLHSCNERLTRYFAKPLGECEGIDHLIKNFSKFVYTANQHNLETNAIKLAATH